MIVPCRSLGYVDAVAWVDCLIAPAAHTLRCLQTPYLHFIHELMRAFPTRPIILLEARHVSVCLHWRALTTDQMAHAAQEILHKHGWDQAAFIGHSYGTFVMSRIAQLHQSIVQSMVRLSWEPLNLLCLSSHDRVWMRCDCMGEMRHRPCYCCSCLLSCKARWAEQLAGAGERQNATFWCGWC